MSAIKGGEKLQARLEEIARKLGNAKTVKVGFLADATYPDGTSVAMVAAVQEFGAPSRGIPPRPFFRNMVAAKSGEWPKAIADLVVDTDYDALRTLQLTGEGIAGQLRTSIIETDTPPLAQSTIDRKGFDKPLVATGQLLASVEYEVKE